MLRSLFPSVVEDARDLIVIAPHHPDRLRRPSASPGALAHERFQQTLAWNVFRTLELISPAFWLRRLQAHLLSESLTATPQTVRVHMWLPLTPPPAQCVDGARPHVLIDVMIETEHALWILMVGAGRHVTARVTLTIHLAIGSRVSSMLAPGMPELVTTSSASLRRTPVKPRLMVH
jgi:hypothetical protein